MGMIGLNDKITWCSFVPQAEEANSHGRRPSWHIELIVSGENGNIL
jgi:hypothetical protein